MLTELKPCPFCGAKPEIVTRDVEPQGDPWYGAKCETFVLCDCGACLFDGAFHEGFYDAEIRAVAAWNRRVISASPDEGREALAWRVEWERGGKTWVRTYTNERDAIDDKQAFSGTVTPLYPLATAPTMIEEDAAIELLRKFMEYRDSDYVPNVLFDQARLIIDRAAAKGES